MGHRKDFEWLVLNRFGMDEAKKVDWSGPRLICIAGDFTKYDEHAVKQMNRNIDLIRYRKFDGDLLLLEQLTSTVTPTGGTHFGDASSSTGKAKYTTVSNHMAKASPGLMDRYESLAAYLTAIGDDVTVKTTDYYIAYRRIKNFACVEFRNQFDKLLIYAKLDPSTVKLDPGFTRDMRKISHFGTGDLEITLTTVGDLDRAKPLLDQAYNES
jgi:predicted transport protein